MGNGDVVHVKICGLRDPEEAYVCVRLGASSIGVNFVPGTPRWVDMATARAVAAAAHAANPDVVVVGVVADMDASAMRALATDASLDCLQLHGNEAPEALTPLLPHAYKAVRVAGPEDVARARTFPGDYLLVDAKVDGTLGGSGATFDWSLVRELARERRLTLAGGLRAENVAEAIALVRPWCVDVASGVERAPGVKNLARVAAFIAAARGEGR
jgi:phosphoribosylanthranilate isomerase